MGSSKKVTVGYRYFLGMHMILCHGPVDKLVRIVVDKKTAWSGESTGGPIVINEPELFGGESREGGVSGTVDFETGAPTQGRNSYLMSKLGANIPAFRGVAAAVLRQVYVGINPYLKNWAFRAQRIHTRMGGIAQWYDAKAEVPKGQSLIQNQWHHVRLVVDGNVAYGFFNGTLVGLASLDFVPNGGLGGGVSVLGRYSTRISDGGAFSGYIHSLVVTKKALAVQNFVPSTAIPDSVDPNWADIVYCVHAGASGDAAVDDKGHAWTPFNGGIFESSSEVTLNGSRVIKVANGAGAFADEVTLGSTFTIDCWMYPTSQAGVPFNASWTESQHAGYSFGLATPVTFTLSHNTWPFPPVVSFPTGKSGDMNPSHIIRECLTDLDWGMGYLESDVDDASFTAAADRLYDEGFGISILWDRQTAIEDFVKEIVRHINAALYVDRTSGKFVLKLVRDDYDIAGLLVLGEAQVEKVENFSRPAFGDLVNAVTVNYWDSDTGANASISAQDTALIQMQGAVVGTTIQYPGCTNASMAARLASRDLTTLSTPLLSCTVYADRTAASLNIGDVFVLDWPELLAEPAVMRVMSLAFGDGRSNQVKIVATEDVFALPGTAAIVPQAPGWTDPSGPPTAAAQRIVVEAPYVALFKEVGKEVVDAALDGAPDAGYVAASAVSPGGGSINATVMEDAGAGYVSQGVADFCPHAVLSAPASRTDTVLSCVDVGELALIDVGDFLQVGDELMSFVSVDASLNILTVGRGVMDTVPQEHAADSVVFGWDSYAYVGQTEYTDGETVNVKLLPVTGQGSLSTSSAPADAVVMGSRAIRPYPPGNVKIGGAYWPTTASGTFTVTWAHRNRLDQQDVLVPFPSGDVTPAPNTRYGLRFLDSSDALLVERQDIGPGTASVVLDYTGDVTMELYTIDDNGESWQRHRHVFAYTPPGGAVVSTITATAYTPVDDSTIIDGGGA